ncbi:MAG: 2-octaprenyl-3-methyl-6-methoxy-1,4-benzoquinol hydroxylase [Pseudohongiellaceae bacterium]
MNSNPKTSSPKNSSSSSNESRHYDIVIAGGGMVGATMACLLADAPVRVALIDRGALLADIPAGSAQTPEFDPRVSALTLGSARLLDRLGVWESVLNQRACAYQRMHVWDAEGTGSITFSADDIDQDALGTIVENSVVLSALYDRLRQIDNLELLTGEEITALERPPGEPGLSLICASGLRVSTDLVIAADGAASPVRSLAGFRTREWDYNHSAVVTTVKTEQPHEFCARQCFLDTGPLAFLPLNTGQGDAQHYSSIVWSAVPELAEQIMTMDDTQFCAALGRAFEHRLGAIEFAAPRYSFPLRQRHAVDYVQDNLVLIGDAAHAIHPLAGQGVNLGLLDAAALHDVLREGLAVGRELSDTTVLRRYQRARKSHNMGMMWVMEGFKHLFSDQALPLRWLRNVGLSSVDRLGVIKNQLARRAMGLDWDG